MAITPAPWRGAAYAAQWRFRHRRFFKLARTILPVTQAIRFEGPWFVWCLRFCVVTYEHYTTLSPLFWLNWYSRYWTGTSLQSLDCKLIPVQYQEYEYHNFSIKYRALNKRRVQINSGSTRCCVTDRFTEFYWWVNRQQRFHLTIRSVCFVSVQKLTLQPRSTAILMQIGKKNVNK